MRISLNHTKMIPKSGKAVPKASVDGIEDIGLCPYSSLGRIKQNNSFDNLMICW